MPLVVILVVVLVVVLLSWRRDRPVRLVPSDGLNLGWEVSTRWRVAPALGRVEVRRFLVHPAFLIGVLVTPFMILFATDSQSRPLHVSTNVALAMVPLGWMTLIATDLIVLRSRRAGSEELFASLPAPQPVRTAGFLLLVPCAFLAATLLLAVAGGAILALALEDPEGVVPSEMFAGVFIVAGSAGLGVAVARWLPHALWGVVTMFATIFAQARFLDTATWPWNSTPSDLRRFLGFLAESTAVPPALEVRRAGWHLVYLTGLVLFISVVALARHGWQRRIVGGGLVVALTIVVVAGLVQTRPPSSGQVGAMIAYLENPSSDQTCATDAAVVYCAFTSTPDAVIAQWRDRVGAVLAVAPADPARPTLEVRQRTAAVVGDNDCQPIRFVDALAPEAARRVEPERVWPDDGHVHPGVNPDQFACDEEAAVGTANGLFVAVQTGAWLVDLPPAPHGDDVQCGADGQARSVLALWLGAQATPGGDALLERTIREGNDGSHLTFPEWDAPPVWGVTYSVADALTALDMLAKPHDEVVAALRANWEQLTAPSTSARTLAELVGVAAHEALEPSPETAACG